MNYQRVIGTVGAALSLIFLIAASVTLAQSSSVTLAGSIPPYAGAPKCDDSLHDERAWHSLWNSEYGCHYDHEHHANPHEMDAVFGSQVYDWFDGEISYPWQTFMGASYHFENPPEAHSGHFENDMKHTGYRWMVKSGIDCHDRTRYTIDAENCVTDYRLAYHALISLRDAVVTWHSMFIEVNAVNLETFDGGYLATGGWLDTGGLEVPRGSYIPLPNDHPDLAHKETGDRPYRFHCSVDRISCLTSWNSDGNFYNEQPGAIRIQRGFGVQVRDGWGPVDVNDLNRLVLNCPDFQCKYNDSEATIFRIWVTVPRELDGSSYDQDPAAGYVTMNGYTNRYGDIVDGCTGVGLDCVPLVMEHFPVEDARHRGGRLLDNVEYDISPPGEYWIEHP